MTLDRATFDAFVDELQKIASSGELGEDLVEFLQKIAYEPLNEEGLQTYLGYLGNPKTDAHIATLKADHDALQKAKGIPHDAYQAAMRNIGGYHARPGHVVDMVNDPDFQRQYRRAGQPILDVNTSYAQEARPELDKVRQATKRNPSFTHAYKLDPAPKALLAKDLPLGIHGKQIPMNMVSENIPNGRGLLTPVTNLVHGMSFNTTNGEVEGFLNKLRKAKLERFKR